MPKLVEIVDLVTNFYTYEGVVRALNRISLTIEHGVTFGLVGESGCGKSVLVRSLMRIIKSRAASMGGEFFFTQSVMPAPSIWFNNPMTTCAGCGATKYR